jgi:2-octaprenyl-6-methoxyphenol hydroxylase
MASGRVPKVKHTIGLTLLTTYPSLLKSSFLSYPLKGSIGLGPIYFKKSVKIIEVTKLYPSPSMPAVATQDIASSRSVYHCDVAIVGGGIIGHTLALALQSSGLEVILLEAAAESIAITKGRAYVFSVLSGQLFDKLGVWAEVLPHIAPFSQIQISDSDCPVVVKLHPEDLGTPALGYGVGHSVMLQALQTRLQENPHFTYLCPAQVEASKPLAAGAELTVRTEDGEVTVRSRLTVGADGSQSPLRDAAGIRTKGWSYWQSCVTATIIPSQAHQNIAYERFWYDGPMGVLPLADGRVQIVWTAPHDRAQELLDLSAAEFIDRLETATGGHLGKLTLDSQRFLFPVRLMQSDRYVQERLALVGDAAHCCHPVAGQGMNLGIRDAMALAEVLTTAVEQSEDIGSLAVLQRYQRWRKPENWAILAFTDFLDRLFSNHWWPLIVVRRLGLRALRQLYPLRHLSLRLMTGLAGRIPQVGMNKLQ